MLDSKEEVHNRITYTGQQFDGVTGQYYLRARYYNPVIGRFTQEDIYRGDGLNLYAYCKNNPVVYYDPSGFESASKERLFSSENENLFVMDLQLFGKKKASNTDFVVYPNGITESVSNGQHVLDRHVGKSDSDLINRANDPKFTGKAASTYNDDIINKTITDPANIKRINNWLSSGASRNLPLDYSGNDVIGKGVMQGSNTVENMQKAKVVLKSDGSGGYNILTSYPEK